ncbi:hypothetical protein [Actinotalea sp. C106]|uniref:hypothetical protein n=1 Tax=Actinotalea sp. C106 TaxID=2908644 RepID=UPI0020292DD2|nr:hypothetical protein [Actinotalea sp. C106]
MDDREDRAVTAASVPMSSGGMSPSMGVAAPVGAVSRKDRQRAARTSLSRDGASTVLLRTALAGVVSLQRRDGDGTWQTLDRRRASRLRRTRIALPQKETGTPQTFRVVFSPKNPNIASWISADVDG